MICVASRSMVANWSAAAWSQGPTVPSGHWTRTSRRQPGRARRGPSRARRRRARRRPSAPDGRCVADLDLDPGADRVAVRAQLGEADGQPVPGRGAIGAAPSTPVLRQSRTGASKNTSTRSGRPSRLKSARARRDRGRSRRCRPPARLAECAIGLAEKEVGRVSCRVVGLLIDVALRHEEVHEPIVVDVLELGVPGGRRQRVPASRRPGRVTPTLTDRSRTSVARVRQVPWRTFGALTRQVDAG